MRPCDVNGDVVGSGIFPSFWEGLSLRLFSYNHLKIGASFPFLLGGTFIEAQSLRVRRCRVCGFPFLLGGTFIEATLGA